MLTLLRDKLSGWFAKILFGLLIIVFSFFGIEGYFVASHATWVAKVGDHDVGGQEFQDALNRARQRQLQHNPQIDPKFLDGNAFKQDVLEGLIQRQMLINLGDELGVMVPDSLLRREIARIPQFQVDGKFDPATYTAVLAANGLTPERFQEMERGDLSVQLLPQALGDSSIVTASEIDGYLRLIGQTRDFSYVDLPVPQAASGTVSEAEIGAYYKVHAQQYMSPEQVSVQYVDLGVDNVPAPPAPSAEELRALYAKNQSRFVVPSQYEVSHILISLPKNATPAQKAAALAQAQKVDVLAHAPGANFAALAKQYSDDLGSKNQGGSLGWLGLGDTDPAFQAAMIALRPGQVSAPVLTSDGYHIIELQAERAGVTKPFAEVKDVLTADYLKQVRSKEYSHIAGKLIDAIDSNPGSLEDAAKALNVPVQVSPLFARSGGTGLFAHPKVVQAAFSGQVLKDNNTSDPINLSPEHLVLLHLARHVPAQPLPLAAVAARIKATILAQRVAMAASKQADALLARLKAGTGLDTLAKSVGASVQTANAATPSMPNLDPALLTAVFKLAAPAPGKSVPSAVDLGQGHYALVQLSAVHPGDVSKLPSGQREYIVSQLRQMQSGASVQAFLDALRRGTKIETAPNRM